ncbi:mge1 [Candida theae]|uniref:GrpE protein homolog n=1 Tax=Candida theae TaxID=1198502 RepID=A0AAD5BHR7_9ASCO|nr:mge1 [Candida theae]KAI5963918.1 mge1 [Candida theae]
MQRALLQSVRRTIQTRASVTSSVFRSSVCVPPRQQFIRFNSTNAEAKNGAESASTANEQAEQKSTREAENDNQAEAAEPTESPEVKELREKLEKKDKDLALMKNHYAKAKADFISLQETTKKEVQKAKDFALQKLAKDLLESIDNFNFALDHVKDETLKANEEVKNLYEGVDMTRNVFEKTLQRHGIEKIEPLGEKFDPNLHEATFEIAQPDKEPGSVFFVQQSGYTLNNRVLRPAKVGVVKSEDK